ncbi:MAG: hypothetical protein HZB57_03215 [Gammaproteobacteria bacterium]|nr:hypothetical protein [Gammaproteobacteria bacterium]
MATLLGAMLCSSAQAATVFSPTDTTVNFIEFFGGGAALLGVFDDSDPSFLGSYLAVQASGDQVTFTPSGVDYSLTNVSGLAPSAFTLSGSDHFALAAWSPGLNAWLEPDAIYCTAASGSCSLSWSGLLVELAVDLAEASPFTTIPLPSSVYLLGSGVLGLAIVARRRISRNYLTPS